jgi:dTDP-4-amino-4,6-dideoxygalactose transaminase
LLPGVQGIRLLEFDERYRSGFKNIVAELMDDWPLSRADTISVLNAEGILARVYYAPPLHRKPMKYEFVHADLPLTDQLSEKFLNLPCGHLVSVENIGEIVGMLAFISVNGKAIEECLTQKCAG